MAEEARKLIRDRKRGYDLAPMAELPPVIRTITVLDDNGFVVRTVDFTQRTRNEARP